MHITIDVGPGGWVIRCLRCGACRDLDTDEVIVCAVRAFARVHRVCVRFVVV